jgi:hypothetical protein
MFNKNLKGLLKNLLISFNIFCLGAVTYFVFAADFESAKTLQSLAIFVWLHYITGDLIKKISI